MNLLPSLLWSQLAAATDMLENAIVACPNDVWSDSPVVTDKSWYEFWYLASHTLFWLDYYVTEVPQEFAPPQPFGLEELDPAGVLPPRVYSKQELLDYLNYCRARCHRWLSVLTDDSVMNRRYVSARMDFCLAELLIHITRHTQHHAAQLNLLLRQRIDSAPRWVFRGKLLPAE